MLTALTRDVSRSLSSCELEYLTPQEIDVDKAIAQHQRYKQALANLGLRVISMRSESDLPDGVFVEDAAVALEEVAVITTMGSPEREKEVESFAKAMSYFRPLRYLRKPAKLEGGDVLRVERTLYVGLSSRSDHLGIEQLSAAVKPFGYSVVPVRVLSCLHLKTGCCYLGDNTILANTSWIDTAPLRDFRIIGVHADEPWASNVLRVSDTILASSRFPKTIAILEKEGYNVSQIDISELMKAEAGLTCLSVIFESNMPMPMDVVSGYLFPE